MLGSSNMKRPMYVSSVPPPGTFIPMPVQIPTAVVQSLAQAACNTVGYDPRQCALLSQLASYQTTVDACTAAAASTSGAGTSLAATAPSIGGTLSSIAGAAPPSAAVVTAALANLGSQPPGSTSLAATCGAAGPSGPL